MEGMKTKHIPAFGHWDYCNDLPITQYFESAWQAGLTGGHFRREKPAYQPHHRYPKFGLQMMKGQQKQQEKGHPRKQGRVSEITTLQTPSRPTRTSKAIDEDLYKIPPELLYQKPRRKRLLRNFLSGCLGLNCIP